MPSPLIAYCGLYCGACSFKIAFQTQDRRHLTAMPSQYDALKDVQLEDCPGCRLENKCGECKIRDCAVAKEVEYCSQCEQHPCELIMAFANDGKPHHAEILQNAVSLQAMGEQAWLTKMQAEHTCATCHACKSWYFDACTCKPL